MTRVKQTIKSVNKSERDIETSMLDGKMHAFKEEVLRWINTAADKNSKLFNIWQWDAFMETDLTTDVVDFKLLSTWR